MLPDVSSILAAEPFIKRTNFSVLFLKDKNTILSSNAWQVAIGLNVSIYKDVLSTTMSNLSVIEQNMQEFIPTSKLRQVETLVQSLENLSNSKSYFLN